ncbi:MAG: sulfite exporter TauE/SafE family protein [Longispora sp.]|nr:sulfite exporter TauE/SafE family protein [Longispora sp. (in: high G+C Gram-positive bacteria)]
MRRLCLLGLAVVAFLATSAAPASAHPLGNFTTNQYSGLTVGTETTTIDYVVDMAELPAYQLRQQQWRENAPTREQAQAFAAGECTRIAALTRLSVAGKPIPVTVMSRSITFPPGTAGLDTLRLECQLRAAASIKAAAELTFAADAYPGRLGWREITAASTNVTLTASDVPVSSVSRRLTAYPDTQLTSPSDARTARLSLQPGGGTALSTAEPGAAATPSRGVDWLTHAFTDFIGRPRLTLTIGLLAVAIALALGAAHALAPGHGKTVMAAYLVAERGSLRHAGVIAATVTLTHTGGVLVLGLLLCTTLAFAPQQVYSWLGIASGILLVAVGGVLLHRAWTGKASLHHHHHGAHGHSHSHSPSPSHDRGHARDHDHGHGELVHAGHQGESNGGYALGNGHSHGGSGHHHDDAIGHDHDSIPTEHTHSHLDKAPRSKLSLFTITVMGFAGGLVPSPSAIVILLGAIALGRTWFGILLVFGYGLGMAVTLTSVGFLLARWRHKLEPRLTSPTGLAIRRFLPLATSALVVLVGLGVATQAAVAL